ncbi:unnamed protein product [Larinioides sclopetarius]|uniref:Uncharacterized protein n=1 Tax=Larinioides sclopetarius TaxID=280406 RepID=A0AAV2AX80_9ARAC
MKTGGGRNSEKNLASLEDRIHCLIGMDTAYGLETTESESLPVLRIY